MREQRRITSEEAMVIWRMIYDPHFDSVLSQNTWESMSELYLHLSEQKKITSSRRRRFKHLHREFLQMARQECRERWTVRLGEGVR